MKILFFKLLIFLSSNSLFPKEIQAFVESQHTDGKVLQVPSVQRLLHGLSNTDREQSLNSFKSELRDEKFHRNLSSRNHQLAIKDFDYFLRLNDEGDGALPATSDEKKGDFTFGNGVATGKGKYTISKKAIYINVKISLNRVKTKTKPTPSPTPTAVTKPTIKSTTLTTNSMANTSTPTKKPTSKPEANATQPKSNKEGTTTKPTSKTEANATTPKSNKESSTTKPTSNPEANKENPDACKDSAFHKEGLATHNKYRAIHNSPAMKINCSMSKEAYEYAQQLADLGSLVQSGYSDRPGQGENLYLGCSSSKGKTATEAVQNWYDEVCKYDFGEEGPQKGTDKFTQVVWKTSLELGLGMSQKDENGMICTYIVGRYKPQGNFDDGTNGYKDNVVKGSFDENYCNSLKDGVGLDGGHGLRRFNK